MKPKEAQIQQAIIDFLSLRGFRVYRRNVGFVYTKDGRGFRLGNRGQADLYGWHVGTGRHLEVEVKRPGEHLTPWQLAWIIKCEEDGAIAFWADSVGRAEAALKDFGI